MGCAHCGSVLLPTDKFQVMWADNGNWVVEIVCPYCHNVSYGTITKFEIPYYFERRDP
jgi:RNase P subunit RPR2